LLTKFFQRIVGLRMLSLDVYGAGNAQKVLEFVKGHSFRKDNMRIRISLQEEPFTSVMELCPDIHSLTRLNAELSCAYMDGPPSTLLKHIHE
ncbi:hypothetical protein AAVH_36279, partial [Aphelenchoides avenae]